MSFNIGSQNAQQINNVGGDQTIHGGQNAAINSREEARQLVQQLRDEVDGLGLDSDVKREATRQLTEMDRELQQSQPDQATLGARLGRVAETLTSAGAAVAAGTSLGVTIGRLATWLGPFGQTLAQALRG